VCPRKNHANPQALGNNRQQKCAAADAMGYGNESMTPATTAPTAGALATEGNQTATMD